MAWEGHWLCLEIRLTTVGLGKSLLMSFCHGASVLDSSMHEPRIFEMIP
jgi:hypothetical protein